MAGSRQALSVVDRTLIEVRLRDGFGVCAIARALGRSAGTISDEINRHGGRLCYQAQTAMTQAAAARRLCGRKPRLGPDGALFAQVAALLRKGWSPEQIAGRRERIEHSVEQTDPPAPTPAAAPGPAPRSAPLSAPLSASVSHETIYAALYALPHGELRREMLACLRQAKPARGRTPKGSERRGKLCDMTSIHARPHDVHARLVPGHWEGDLVMGANLTAVGTLVERTTRFLLLVLMPTRKADVAASAFAGALNTIPAPLRRTLTYDQGKEMARHKDLALATDMRVFFADPHSPWQRGTNENTNGLLRQYFPKGLCLAGLTQHDLDTVAASLNGRPRKTLGYDTPDERFTALVAQSAASHTTPPTLRSKT